MGSIHRSDADEQVHVLVICKAIYFIMCDCACAHCIFTYICRLVYSLYSTYRHLEQPAILQEKIQSRVEVGWGPPGPTKEHEFFATTTYYLFIYFKTLSSFQFTIIRIILGCIKHNTKQSMKQIIKAKNNGDEMRQAEQVHDMVAYTRPTLQIMVL